MLPETIACAVIVDDCELACVATSAATQPPTVPVIAETCGLALVAMAAGILLLVPIEIISYFIRPFSLSIRLFANMLAGHTMLKVFGGFVVMLGIIGGWAPLAFIVVFTGLEMLIAFLQAYVFAILTCLYLNDAVHLHH